MKFLAILLLLLCIACTPQPLLNEGFVLYATVTIQDDWCHTLDGQRANGTFTYLPAVHSVGTICISRKSDDIRRTMNHEFEHAWLHASGNDVKLFNP